MTYHFLTQPLPNWASVYMHRLPRWVLQGMTVGTLVMEVVVPLLSWAPYPLFAWSPTTSSILDGMALAPAVDTAAGTAAAETASTTPLAMGMKMGVRMAAAAAPALAGVGAARAVQAVSALVYAQLMFSIASTGNFGAWKCWCVGVLTSDM